jgi:uncharacterized protein with HEPN domain
MDDRTRAWLYDILSSIQDTNSYLDEGNKDYAHFPLNLQVKKAFERNLEIIGQALQRLLEYLPDTRLSNAEKIIDISHRITDLDDALSDEIIKNTVLEYLPKLRDEIHLLIIQSNY